jgi:hypothetical protein
MSKEIEVLFYQLCVSCEETWARIFKLLRSPGINSKGLIPPAFVAYSLLCKKKVREFPVPSRDVTTKLFLDGNNDVITELFLPRGSLVSDIPDEDGKLVNLLCINLFLLAVPSPNKLNSSTVLCMHGREKHKCFEGI